MRRAFAALGFLLAVAPTAGRGQSGTIAQPIDRPFPGTITLAVDARDVPHRIFTVHEAIPVPAAGPLTLLYPRWEGASHGPTVAVVALAGLTVTAGSAKLRWRRDPIEPHAFQIDVPAGVAVLDVAFQVIADDSVLRRDLVSVGWQRLLLYPAGYYARNIPVAASLLLADGLQPVTSLQVAERAAGRFAYRPVALDRLLDSPVDAAPRLRRIELASGGRPAVTMTLLSDDPGVPALDPVRVAAFRRMVAETAAVFGRPPYPRYDIVMRMTSNGSTGGVEHLASAEIEVPDTYFTDWAHQLNGRDIVPHEYVHAWNGLYRRPAGQSAPTPNDPLDGALLWVYEGQTEFWGRVLASRAGLRTPVETRDRLALDAAAMAGAIGRRWKPLSDDVNYPAFMLGRQVPWRDWQRRRHYYEEGVLLWLDVDAVLREHSDGRAGLDQVARRFFAVRDTPVQPYTFDDLCAALNAVAPFDWRSYFARWLDGGAELDPLVGLTRQGWQLVFTDTPTEIFAQDERENDVTDLTYSIGLTVTANGRVRAVAWAGPAFAAGLAPSVRITAISGAAFTPAGLVAAVRNAGTIPVSLSFEQDGRTIVRTLSYRGTLRYPRLERIADRPDRLSALLAPRAAPAR